MVDLDALIRASRREGKCPCGHSKRSHSNDLLKMPCRFCDCADYGLPRQESPNA